MPNLRTVPDPAQTRVVQAWDRIAPALVELVGRAPHPAAAVRGSRWTVRELTAHLVAVLECYTHIVRGGASPFAGARAADMASLKRRVDRAGAAPIWSNSSTTPRKDGGS